MLRPRPLVPVASLAVLSLVASAGLASSAWGQTATVDLGNLTLNCAFTFSCGPFTRNSQSNPVPSGTAQFVPAAAGYSYQVDGTIRTSGQIAGVIPNGSTLAQAFEAIQPGTSIILTGYVRNPSGARPASVLRQSFNGTVSGFAVGLTLMLNVESNGVVTTRFQDISLPPSLVAGTLALNAGTFARVSTWVPSAPQPSEWHLDGDLLTYSTAGNGPGRMRYLDDAAFGTILGGVGNETTPNPAAPFGRTAAQSAFGTTTSFGIPGPGGEVDTVYRTSPARNTSDPNPDLRRGIGLAVWPRTQPLFPGQTHFQWTMIWDMYIPAASWTAEADNYIVSLLQDNHNNDGAADMVLRRTSATTAEFLYGPEGVGTPVALPATVAPDQWFRLAFASDGAQTQTGRIFVNGVFVGSTIGDWIYNAANPSNPKYSDGTAVPSATWNSWGQFPSPWSTSAGGKPMASTFCMFADLTSGHSESVYLANFLFTDTTMTDAQINALGGPNARGIMFLRPPATTACSIADICGIGGPPSPPDGIITGDDFNAFINAFANSDALADVCGIGGPPSPPDGLITGDDFNAFIAAFAAGCP